MTVCTIVSKQDTDKKIHLLWRHFLVLMPVMKEYGDIISQMDEDDIIFHDYENDEDEYEDETIIYLPYSVNVIRAAITLSVLQLHHKLNPLNDWWTHNKVFKLENYVFKEEHRKEVEEIFELLTTSEIRKLFTLSLFLQNPCIQTLSTIYLRNKSI